MSHTFDFQNPVRKKKIIDFMSLSLLKKKKKIICLMKLKQCTIFIWKDFYKHGEKLKVTLNNKLKQKKKKKL